MMGIAEIEARRCLEQGRLDRLQDPKGRNRSGLFATPNPLAVAIAAQVLGLGFLEGHGRAIRFLDPAIGSASFYSALRQVVSPGVSLQASGIEVDPVIAEAADRLWGPLGLRVTVGDFTRADPPMPGHRANLILANPPYVRHHHLGLLEKRRLKDLVSRRVGVEVGGLAGLYVYFLLLADAWLEDEGLAAWLVPSEFMDVNYGTAIKDYLTRRVRLRQVHRFSPLDGQFADALVTSAVVIFEKAPPKVSDSALMSLGGPMEAPERSERVSIADLRTARKWSSFPKGIAPAVGRGQTLAKTTLGDLFTIRRGLVTGSNSFFIMSPDEAHRRGLPERFLRPILPSPRYLSGAIIEADERGAPAIARALVLLDCDLLEHEVRRDHPSLWSYLQEGVARGVPEGYLASHRTPWYAQERRESPPFVCTYMGRARSGRPPFRIFWNRSRAVAANVYLLLYPKGMIRVALEERPALAQVVLDRLREIQPSHFINEGRVYGGGLHKIEPKELATLPADAILRAIDRPDTREWV